MVPGAQSPNSPRGKRLVIYASRVFDPESLQFLLDQAILISTRTGIIIKRLPISQFSGATQGAHLEIVDLRPSKLALFPGFIDAHVHMFLHPYSETSWYDQVTNESLAERTIRAVKHCNDTLLAGFTTVRDLGTEGAEDADLDLRTAVSSPKSLIPGPRIYITNRAIVSTGSYGPKGNLRPHSEGVDGMTGAEAADGVTGCKIAVRRQVGVGVDWIKIYADYRFRSRLSSVSPNTGSKSIRLFDEDEFKALIDTAHSLGVKVAAHAIQSETIKLLVKLGIDSIEHGLQLDLETLELIKQTKGKTALVPTLAVFAPDGLAPGQSAAAKRLFKDALSLGPDLKIGCGGDTGTFPHGRNALEMIMMIRFGADWRHVVRWATKGNWEIIRGFQWDGETGAERLQKFQQVAESLVGVVEGDDSEAFSKIQEWPLGDNDVPLGSLESGFAADIIGIAGDFTDSNNVIELLSQVSNVKFVMKSGVVVKREGISIAWDADVVSARFVPTSSTAGSEIVL